MVGKVVMLEEQEAKKGYNFLEVFIKVQRARKEKEAEDKQQQKKFKSEFKKKLQQENGFAIKNDESFFKQMNS